MFGTIISILAVVCAVLVIYDVWKNQKKLSDTHKILWTIAAVIFSIVTAIVYYFVAYKKK